MHELSITESILEIALRHANQANAKKIVNIHLVIGDLSSIIDESVQFYWDIIAKDSIAEGANLIFNRIPTQIRCLDCGHEYNPKTGRFSCQQCNSQRIKIIAGEEFYMDAIDIEGHE